MLKNPNQREIDKRTSQLVQSWKKAKEAFVTNTGLKKPVPIVVKVPIFRTIDKKSTGITSAILAFEQTPGSAGKAKKLEEFRRAKKAYVDQLNEFLKAPPAPDHLKENAAWHATYERQVHILIQTLTAIETTMNQLVTSAQLTEKQVDGWTQQAATIREKLKATLARAHATVNRVQSTHRARFDLSSVNNDLSTAARDVSVSLNSLAQLRQRFPTQNFPPPPADLLAYLNNWHTGGHPNFFTAATTPDARDEAFRHFLRVIEQVSQWAEHSLGMK